MNSVGMYLRDEGLFEKTVLEIKNIRGTDHPFYWGGFILIGDPGLN